MANVGQIVAALAGGALLAIAAMQGIRLYALSRTGEQRHEAERRREERERRIDTAARAVLDGVEAARRRSQPDAVVEVRSKAHLRMLVRRPCPEKCSRRGPAGVRAGRSPRAGDR